MRLRTRFFTLFLFVSLAIFTSVVSPGSKADEEIELDSCTDRCDRNYIACCKQHGGGQCPMSCQNEQIACYSKCN